MDKNQVNEMNKQVIAEFRANEGKVGGPFAGAPLLILHSVGAKSGQERLNPMMYRRMSDGRYAIFASKAGADSHPAWYHNIKANPQVTFEVGPETLTGTVAELTGDEREVVWAAQKAEVPQFADYEAKTERTIPVLAIATQ